MKVMSVCLSLSLLLSVGVCPCVCVCVGLFALPAFAPSIFLLLGTHKSPGEILQQQARQSRCVSCALEVMDEEVFDVALCLCLPDVLNL